MNIKKTGLLAGPLAFILILFLFKPEGLSQEARAILASTAWIAIWWITEAIPIAVTALLPIVLFPLTGGLDIKSTTSAFGHRFVFLYLGGFILAIAIEKWGLHKRIALNIIRLVGTNITRIILGFMLATAFLSMWISNTATSVMMLPIGMAIVAQLKDNPATRENEHLQFGKALMLAIAYSASIGGIATLIGTPPNLVLAGVVQKLYDIEISFLSWFKFGLPISILLLGVCWWYLTNVAFHFQQKAFPGGKAEVNRLLKELGKMNYEEKAVLAVFIATAFCWISRSFLLEPILPGLDDTVIAIAGGIAVFLIPSRRGSGLLNWNEATELPWGIILLFGGGMALAQGFDSSGLALWLAEKLGLLEGIAIILLLLLIIAAVNFLTEITSNLATTSMLLPVLAPIAMSINVHPYILLVSATVAASCAFMLPVATPPNAVVFGAGYLRIPDMVRTGFWMNLISIFLLTALVYLLLPFLWGFDPGAFPEELRMLK